MRRRPTPASYPAPTQASTDNSRMSVDSCARPPPLPRRLQVSLPYPPSTNRWVVPIVVKGHAQLMLSPVARAYKEGVSRSLIGREPMAGPLAILKLHAYPPNDAYDLDNVFKVLFDALKGRAWLDDRQVKRIGGVEMFLADGAPRVELVVEQILLVGDQLDLLGAPR